MNEDGRIDLELRAAGERWRATRRSGPTRVDPALFAEKRPTTILGPTMARAAASLAAVAVLAFVGLIVLVLLRPVQQPGPPATSPIGSGTPAPTTSPRLPQELYLENRGGPTFTVRIGGNDITTVSCDAGATLTAGQENVPPLPWDVKLIRVRDGATIVAAQITGLPRWFVQIGDEPLGFSTSPVGGPMGPSCLPTASPPQSDSPAVLISPSEAIERVVAFVDAPELTADLAVEGPTAGAWWPSYGVHGRQVSASVNAHDGTITTLLLFANVGFGGATIDADRSVEVAEEFLHQHQVPFDGLDRTVRFQDHGETSEYVVEWIGHQGEIILPDSRVVGVDASTGLVFHFVYMNHPYDPPAEPLVDRATAEAVAVRLATASPQAEVDRSELLVTFTPAEVQRLVWQVYVTEGFSHWVVEVDAETGAAAVIASG